MWKCKTKKLSQHVILLLLFFIIIIIIIVIIIIIISGTWSFWPVLDIIYKKDAAGKRCKFDFNKLLTWSFQTYINSRSDGP